MAFNFLAEVKQFSDLSSWTLLLQLFIICASLVIGNIIRVKIKFMRKSLIPTAIIAGAIILIFKAFFQYVFNIAIIDQGVMENFTYHCLGIGFVALALKETKKEETSSKITVVKTGAMTVGGYLIQGIIGLLSTLVIYLISKSIINSSIEPIKWFAGLLLPLGFGQGTGQALSWGIIYENSNGFVGGASFGLAIATIGFIVASLGGVIYLNVLRRKNIIKTNEGEFKEENTLSDYQTDNDIPSTGSIDKLSIQVALVLSVYALTFGFLYLIQSLLIDTNLLGSFGYKTLSPLIWGFNFLFGTLFAFLFKTVINGAKKKKYMHRQYTNNYLLDRIGGFLFDVMIVAGTAAIKFEAIKGLIIPLIIICSLGTVVTFLFIKKAAKRVFPNYEHEGFLAMFGMLTGTASNGMILLRELDPKYETPMASNLVFQNLPAIVLGFPFLLLVGFAAGSIVNTIITLCLMCLYFSIICIFLFKKKTSK